MDRWLCTLEITVLSCEDLRIGGRSVKKNTYVIARTDPLNYQATTMDTEGGSHPSWNQKLVMGMAKGEQFITLEVHSQILSGDRIVGSARVPVSDFMGGYSPVDYLNFLCYRLVNPNGSRNGIINVSVKVQGVAGCLRNSDIKKKRVDENIASSSTSASKNTTSFMMGKGEKSTLGLDGVVTGVPVWGAINSGKVLGH